MNLPVLKRILNYTKSYSIFILLSFICSAASVVSQLMVPIYTGDAIDVMIGEGKVDFALILNIALLIALMMVITALSQWIMAICNNKITYGVSKDLRNEAFSKMQRLPLSYLDSHPTGDLVSRMIADIDTFSDGLLMGFTQLFTGILTIIGTLGFMLSVNLVITLVVVALTPVSLLVANFIAKHTYKYFKRQTEARGKQTAYINEMIDGMKVVKAFGYEEEGSKQFREYNEELEDASLNAVFYSSLTNPCTRFVNSLVYAAVGFVGALFAINGSITVGQLSIFLSYANQYSKPFNDISSVITELQNAIACADRVFQLLDEEDEIPEKNQLLVPDGNVELKHVFFSYS